MKNLLKKILVVLAIIGTTLSVSNFATSSKVYAEGDTRYNSTEPCPNFLGLTSWDCGIPKIDNENSLKNGIWIIVANVATDITIISAYLVIGYVIYGGYLYTLAEGDAGKVALGKKTLTQAFIGLAIVMSANLIMGTIRIVLVNGNNDITDCANSLCVDPGVLVENLIGWVIGIAGLVSVIFLIYGGITYITSSGDASKLQKAKNMIIYSLIGLAIVALATTITAFVSNAIKEANPVGLLNDNYISKEIYETKIS